MAEPSLQVVKGGSTQLAALDLGSNSFHLMVAQETGGRIQVIDKLKEMVRLAEGLDDEDNLSEPVIERALACLERFGQRLRELPAQNVRIVATNTLRRANNANDFLRRAEAAIGHKVEVISGREEARLIYLGVAHALEDDHDRRLVVDIGGGSTEIILGHQFQAQRTESLYMGCVGLSRTYFADGKIRANQFKAAVNHAKQELEPMQRAYKASGWDTAVGASGTILAIQQVLQSMDRDQNGITRDGLEQIRKSLLQAKQLDNISLSGLPAERAPVFPGGVAILYAIFEALGIELMQATSGALREGVVHDLLGRVHQQDVRDTTVRDLISRYHIDEKHGRKIRETAIGLLAQAANAWRLTDPNDKPMLTWAAELHEIGLDIAHSQYHRHGGYLLRYMDMPGFSSWDQRQLAALVRAHRRKFPTDVDAFTSSDSQRMIRLAVLLRIAVVLHRNRGSSPLPHIEVKVCNDDVRLSLPATWLERHPLTRLDLEQEAGYLKAVPLQLSIKTD